MVQYLRQFTIFKAGNRYRFDGALDIKVDRPFFIEAVPSKYDSQCHKCCFQCPSLRSQSICFWYPCGTQYRKGGSPVFYRKIDVDHDEAIQLTRENYLRWIRSRHGLYGVYKIIVDRTANGERDFWIQFNSNLDYHVHLTIKDRRRLLFYHFLHETDKRYLSELSRVSSGFWETRIDQHAHREYKVVLDLQEISIFNDYRLRRKNGKN